MGGFGLEWQQALAAVFVSGSIIIILSLVGVLNIVINSIPLSIRSGLAVGIGLLIALIGLEWGGIVVDKPGVLVGLGDLKSPPALLTLFGLFLTAILMARKIKGAILYGILATCGVALLFGIAEFHGIAGAPPSIEPTFLKLDFPGLFANPNFWLVIAIFLFLDLFDTLGTLIGVATKAGLVNEDGSLPKASRAIEADASGTVAGALLGTSTVTSYVESAAGVAVGGRTGLTAITTAFLFLLAIFFAPLAKTIGGGYEVAEGIYLYPVIAPPLIIVGSLMFSLVKEIAWDDMAEGFSAYLTIIITPLTFSITEGMSAGFIAYSLLKTGQGRFFEVNPVVHLLALIFLLRYYFLVG
jgi:AGZA family xanthine/uracil permease-like MFS transporter